MRNSLLSGTKFYCKVCGFNRWTCSSFGYHDAASSFSENDSKVSVPVLEGGSGSDHLDPGEKSAVIVCLGPVRIDQSRSMGIKGILLFKLSCLIYILEKMSTLIPPPC